MTPSGMPLVSQTDQLSESLHRQITASGTDLVWLALDAASPNAPPLPAELQQAAEGPSAHAVRLSHPDLDSTYWPQWLPLNIARPEGSHLLRLSIERALSECAAPALRQGQGRRIAGWVAANDGVSEASRHWARNMLQRRPLAGTTLLRLHDPAVLWPVWQLLDPSQRRALLGPIQSWWLLNPLGRIDTLVAPEADAEATSDWAAKRWQDIAHIGAFNAALRQLDSPPPDLQTALETALHAMRRAVQAGFDQTRDLTAYATLSITVHPRFDEHPRLRQALASSQPGQHFLELVADLTAQDWLDVRQATPPTDRRPATQSASAPLRTPT